MPSWRCRVCGSVYDEKKGESATDTKPGIKFEKLPNEWKYPVYGADKTAFSMIKPDLHNGKEDPKTGTINSRKNILELAKKIKATIITTFQAKGIISKENKWNLGILDSVGKPQAREFVNESDLLITAGVGFS